MRKVLLSFSPSLIFILINILIGIKIADAYLNAKPPVGHDLLAASKADFPVKDIGNALDKGTPLGFLDFTFQDSLENIEYLIKTVKPNIVRFHIFNGSGLHLRNSGSYDALYGLTDTTFDYLSKKRDRVLRKYYVGRLRLWKRLAERYPGTHFFVSPVLEHRLSLRGFRFWADVTFNVWPEAGVVNNAANCKGERYDGALLECHFPNRGNDMYSTDGEDIFSLDYKKWLRRTKKGYVRLVWTPGYNERSKDDSEFVDPRDRENVLSVYDIQKLANLTNKAE